MVEERIRWLAQNTRYFSGAELEELVYRIRRNAFERNGRYVEEKDFARALEHFNIHQESRMQEVREHFDYVSEHTNDTSFFREMLESEDA